MEWARPLHVCSGTGLIRGSRRLALGHIDMCTTNFSPPLHRPDAHGAECLFACVSFQCARASMRAHLCLCGFPVLMGARAFLRSGRLRLQAGMARVQGDGHIWKTSM